MPELTWLTTHGDRVTVFPRRGIFGKRWYWHVQAAGNNEIVGHGESYTRSQSALVAAERHHPPVVSRA